MERMTHEPAVAFRTSVVEAAKRWASICVVVGVAILPLCFSYPRAATAAGVVGRGTPASCTEAALDAALAGGGLVTFNCGSDSVTITITSTKMIAQDTTIDGGGRITISGGGAVRVFTSDRASFAVVNLTVANGFGDFGAGGGILALGPSLTVVKSAFVGNRNLGQYYAVGGAITASAGTVSVSDSTFTNNSVGGLGTFGAGGAIALAPFDSGASMSASISNSSFSANSANSEGGAISILDALLVVTNSTFSGNSAHEGGGIYNRGTLTVTNTIVANSTGGNCDGVIADGGHNLQWPGTDCGETIPSLDPKLDPAGLKDNGGPTQTIALLPDSPAINAGDPAVCANPPVNGVDQRGYVRPGTGWANCSIGAFEYNSPGPPPSCVGDCDGDRVVTINELITMVNFALGSAPVTTCNAGDLNGDTVITIDEIIRAVNAVLTGCPARVCGGIAGLPCGMTEVCDLRDPTCAIVDLAGVCVLRPGACPEVYDPVCGCDSVTYSNDCFRLAAAATLAHAGACQ